MAKKSIPNYLGVFESRLNNLRNRIKKEMELPKKQRSRHALRVFIKHAKELRDKLKQVQAEHARHCPHCGGKI